jgi:hypothetical protein
VTYCAFTSCVQRAETWHVGGFTYGVNIGLRVAFE